MFRNKFLKCPQVDLTAESQMLFLNDILEISPLMNVECNMQQPQINWISATVSNKDVFNYFVAWLCNANIDRFSVTALCKPAFRWSPSITEQKLHHYIIVIYAIMHMLADTWMMQYISLGFVYYESQLITIKFNIIFINHLSIN